MRAGAGAVPGGRGFGAQRTTGRPVHRLPAVLVAVPILLAGCAGGAGDEVGGGTAGRGGAVDLYAYAIPEPGYGEVISKFNETEVGEGVEVRQSYGASGDQSREVARGAPADVVSFSLEPDITRLVDAGLVDSGWNADATRGVPFGSVVVLVVRSGNPKNIRAWDDLLRPDVEVVTPNPFGSSSAKWNLLAPYAAAGEGGRNPQAGVDYLNQMLTQVRVQPKSGRAATEAFLQGTGDVLISSESEAIFAERHGDPVEHIVPEATLAIENPVAVLEHARHPEQAIAFRDFLYTTEAQRAWADAGFRPVDPGVAAEYTDVFPQPPTLYTVADLGGWETVETELFAPESGALAAGRPR